MKKEFDFYTVSELEKIPFLIHGFGTGKLNEEDFIDKPEWKGFEAVFLNQIHSSTVHFIKKNPGRGLKGDAMVTALPLLMLTVKTADCLPVLMVEESRRVVAAVHCGWRGTRKRVVKHALEGMNKHYHCQLSSLQVALGPCIGPCCYEVGEYVLKSFEEENFPLDIFQPHPRLEGKFFLDLRKANLIQLLSAGVRKENIYILDMCSHCSKTLPSYRREGTKAGRMFSFISMSF